MNPSTDTERFAGATPGPYILDATPSVAPCSFIVRAKASKCDAWIPVATVHHTQCDATATGNLLAAAPALLAERDQLRIEVAKLVHERRLPTETNDMILRQWNQALQQRDQLREALQAMLDAYHDCRAILPEVIDDARAALAQGGGK